VATVAESTILAVLALTPVDGLLLIHLVLHRRNTGSLVASIAKRWIGGTATGTPEMGAGLNLESKGLGVANDRLFRHPED
jgi:hypothetical protein